MSSPTTLLFVIGLHRSGTSMTYRWLGNGRSCTRLTATGWPEDEGIFVAGEVAIAPTAAAAGPGVFALDPANHLTERDVVPGVGDQMLDAWSQYWDDPQRARVFVEKSPAHTTRTRWLEASCRHRFERVCFLIVLRHPVPTVLSTQRMQRVWSGESSPIALLRHWSIAYSVAFGDAQHLSDVRVASVHDLAQHPQWYAARVGEWLDVDLPAPTVDPSVLAGGRQDLAEAASGWARRHRDLVHRHGFDFDGTDWAPPPPVQSFTFTTGV